MVKIKSTNIKNDGKIFKAIIYTNEIDRENEMATNEFLEELKNLIIGKPVIKNHDWHDIDGAIGTIADARIVDEGELKAIEADLNIVDKQAIEKINNGLFKGVSVGFECEKEETENGVTLLTKCLDAYEVSMVAVPALRNASIKIKFMKGEKNMVFKNFKVRQLLAKYPSLKAAEPGLLKELAQEEVEITEKDIDEILTENEDLKAKVKELEDQIADYKKCSQKEKDMTTILDEVHKQLGDEPVSDELKEVIDTEAKEAVEKGDMLIEHFPKGECAGQEIKGLKEFIDKTKLKYKKLGLMRKAKENKEDKKSFNMEFKAKSVETETEAETEMEMGMDRGVVVVKKGF